MALLTSSLPAPELVLDLAGTIALTPGEALTEAKREVIEGGGLGFDLQADRIFRYGKLTGHGATTDRDVRLCGSGLGAR